MKKQISLKIKTFRVILIVSLVLILLGSATGLSLYTYGSLCNYKSESRHLLNYSLSMQDMEYIEKIFRETKRVYAGMPEEVRLNPQSDEFMDACVELLDDDFFKARDILVKCRVETEQKNTSYMFLDPELNAIVYVVDGDADEWAYLPGQWIKSDLENLEDIEKIGKSKWRLNITHEDEYGWVGTDCEPIYDKNDNLIGYAVMDLDLNDFLRQIVRFLWVLLPAAALLVLLLAFLSSTLLRKHIISHLTSLAGAAREYIARDKVDQADDDPYIFEELDINTSDELEELWRSMSAMETDVRETMTRLRQITAEQERIGAELSIATRIQESALPQEMPDRSEFSICASMEPAKEVGGDFYDYFMIDDDHLAIVVADVSGKGVPAALFMMKAVSTIRTLSQIIKNPIPDKILSATNAQLTENNEEMMFVTTWLGILEISTGKLSYADAGHEMLMLYKNGQWDYLQKMQNSPPLGIVSPAVLEKKENKKFKTFEMMLEAGDTILQYTDGVTDAVDIDEERFEKERAIEAVRKADPVNPETATDSLRKTIREYSGDAPQFDDITMLCLQYHGRAE